MYIKTWLKIKIVHKWKWTISLFYTFTYTFTHEEISPYSYDGKFFYCRHITGEHIHGKHKNYKKKNWCVFQVCWGSIFKCQFLQSHCMSRKPHVTLWLLLLFFSLLTEWLGNFLKFKKIKHQMKDGSLTIFLCQENDIDELQVKIKFTGAKVKKLK